MALPPFLLWGKLIQSHCSCSSFWRSILTLLDSQRLRGSQLQQPLGHSIALVQWQGGQWWREAAQTTPLLGDAVTGIMLWEGMKRTILHSWLLWFPRMSQQLQPGKGWVFTAARCSFFQCCLPLFLVRRGGGQHSSWNRLTSMLVSSLWVSALDLGHSELVRNHLEIRIWFKVHSVEEPAFWSLHTIPAFIYVNCLGQKDLSFLSFPTATAFLEAPILFCLGYGNSFLLPFIYPPLRSCQSDISSMHVGS